MVLSRAVVTEGFAEEMAAFERLLRSLNDGDWSSTTRCEGWQVSDVAGHVAGTLDAVAAARFGEFTEPGHVEAQIERRAAWTASAVADEYAGNAAKLLALFGALDDSAWQAPLGGVASTLGAGMELLWFDTYVHADDVRSALGRPSEFGPGLQASLSYITARLEAAGWGPIEPHVTAAPLDFLMAATGRLDPATLGLDQTVNIYRS